MSYSNTTHCSGAGETVTIPPAPDFSPPPPRAARKRKLLTLPPGVKPRPAPPRREMKARSARRTD